MMQPPLSGILSNSRQDRRVVRNSNGLAVLTTSRYQNPNRPYRTITSGEIRCAMQHCCLARMPDMTGRGNSWSLIVPVKRLDNAKTRLALSADIRADLAVAMASDTVSAGLA